MFWKKNLSWIIFIIICVCLFTLYRHEHSLRLQQEKQTRQLVQDYRALQEKNEMMAKSMDQITHHDESVTAEGGFMDQRKYYRINWKNYIHITPNNYKTGLLGGIKNLQITVDNQTEYPLDNVMVNIEYEKANGKIVKSESININNVPAKSTRKIKAPESRRGSAVKLQLQRITSQAMNFCWTVDKAKLPLQQDPFQCAATASR